MPKDEDEGTQGRPAPHNRRHHALRCYVNDLDRCLIEAAADDEGVSVSEYLRLSATHVAREKGMEAYDEEELIAVLIEATDPADA